MNTIMKAVTVVALSSTMAIAPAMANTPVQTHQTTDNVRVNNLHYAFGEGQDLSKITPMTEKEMQETEGAIAPAVYAIGALAVRTGVFVARQYVSKRQAINLAKRGYNIHAKSRSQAKNIANQAYGRNNVTRHGPSGHKKHVDYSHYQPTNRKFNGTTNNGHIFYGKNYPRK